MTDIAHKKVLYPITKAVWGGAQHYVFDLATAAHTAGAQVLVAYGEPGRLTEELAEQHIPTMHVSGLKRDLGIFSELHALEELVHLFRKERPDVVHLNSSKAGVLGSIAARMAGVPHIVFTAHGWPFQEQRSMLWRVVAYLGSWLTALLSDTVIVISHNDLTLGKKMPGCAHKMHLVYNGIDLSLPFGSGTLIRDAFPKGVSITGTIGELNANKNHIALIERAQKDPDLYVAIVGEGEERTRLEAAIAQYDLSERVKLFGFIPAREVLRGFDTFALPSKKEGLPYVLLEARAAGLPIEAARVGGVGEILDAPDLNMFSLEHMLKKTFGLY